MSLIGLKIDTSYLFSTSPLGEYDHERVVVDLPAGKTITDYRWIAVWNRQTRVSY